MSSDHDIDSLDHDGVALLLRGHPDDDTLRAEVAELAAARGLAGFTLVDVAVDLDVPIPLIIEVDGCNRLSIAKADGGTATLYVDLWGEVYDRRYGARLRLVDRDLRDELWGSPPKQGPADPARWDAAVERLSRHIGRPLDGAALRDVLAATWPSPLREAWETMVSSL